MLVGRADELELIGSFLDAAAVRGQALVLFGEPGVGKTALLDAAAVAASAAGTCVLRAAGVEFEAEVPFAGLNQALFSQSGQFDRLSAVHRDAISVALGFGTGAPSDPLVVFTAALALLREVAQSEPLLLIVDDVQWLDRSSASALGFVARRLDGSRVGLIAASRFATGSFFDRAGMPAYELQPLNDDASGELIDARFPGLERKVRQRVLTEAQGNPLALLELPSAVGDSPRISAHRLPAVLPLGRRLHTLFAARVEELPAASRRLILLAALDGTGDVGVLNVASQGGGLDDLLPAQRAELVALDETNRRLTFRHPLVGATVVQLSSGSERRKAHRVLAEALEDHPYRKAWHLAEATIGPDEHVAGLLEQAGSLALGRGDGVGAVTVLLRSADLSPPGSERSRRLALAAYVGADVTGELRDVSRLLIDARNASPVLAESLQAAVTTAHLLINGAADIDTAHRLLVAAIDSVASPHDATDAALIEAIYTLLTVCFFGGRPELWEPFHAAVARLRPEVPTLLSLSATLFADPARATLADLAELEVIISHLHDESDPVAIVRTGRASFFVDRHTGCREAQWRVVRDGRDGGAVTSAIHALINLSLDDYLVGNWDEAEQLADEGLELCAAHGYHLLGAPLCFAKAIVAAGRGDEGTTREQTEKLDRWAAPRRAEMGHLYTRYARGFAALARADFAAAYDELSGISPPGSVASHVPLALWTTMDLCEAAVRTGRQAEAVAHAAATADAGIAALSPRLALLSRASAAIARPDDHAIDLFEQALGIAGIARWPFDVARVHLAYGERLRRTKAIAGARSHLRAAFDTFQRLNANPWVARVTGELRATRMLADGVEPAALTPQEREVAQLAATGLTNREIGDRLLLSHRTVGAHLYRIFPKLGITSRAALRDALSSDRSSTFTVGDEVP